MDRPGRDAAERRSGCQQFAVPISPFYHSVGANGSMQSSLWSYSPPAHHQSVWQPASLSRDTVNQSDCQSDDYLPYQDSSYLSHCWQPAAVTGDDDVTSSVRTTSNFDLVCHNRLQSHDTSQLNSTAHRQYSTSPRPHTNTVPHHVTSLSDADHRWTVDDAEHCTGCYQHWQCTSVHARPPGFHNCDTLDDISVGSPRTVKSEFPAAGNLTCSHSEIFPDTCNLHSLHCASSYLAEQSREELCDTHGASAARLHHHLYHPAGEQCVSTNCIRTDYESSVVNSRQQVLCPRQSASMNDLDDIDLPLHNASTLNAIHTEVNGGNVISPAAVFSSSSDTSCATAARPSSSLLHLSQKERPGPDAVANPESSHQTVAEVKDKRRSELDVENSVEANSASVSLPSSCPTQPLLSRKSKKRVRVVVDEKFPAAVPKKTVCDVLPACDDAVENKFSTKHSTNHVNIESDVDHAVAESVCGKNPLREKYSETESVAATSCSASEHAKSPDTDSVETDKLDPASQTHVPAESCPRSGPPTSGLRHRRPLRKPSRAAVRPRPPRHSGREQDQITMSFDWKRLLESVDWQQQQRNFGLCFYRQFTAVFFWYISSQM